LDHQNNYEERSRIMSNVVKNFDILATSLSVPHNYYIGPQQNYFQICI